VSVARLTPELEAALEKLIHMKYPSVAGILRRNRYEYEAQQVERLVAAYREAKQLPDP
jgi:hypothetical protein